MKNIINKIGYDYDIDIVELEIPVDHIHMVVRSEPKTVSIRNYADNKKYISKGVFQDAPKN